MALVSKNFSDIITFTRASSATFVGSNGLIQSTPQSKNLLTWTEAFDNAAWTKGNATVTADATVSPDGATTADSFIENTATSGHTVAFGSITFAASTAYTVTLYVKPTGRSWFYMQLASAPFGGANTRAWFNVTTGVVGTQANCTGSIQSVGNGWYRCGITATATVGGVGATAIVFGLSNADNVSSYTGDGASGAFIWGAQLEVGSTATDYTKNDGGLFPPRFDYDPITLAAKGLLIEEQRTNLVTRSEDFGNATWSKTTCTISTDATTSPAGDSTADKLIPDVGVTTYNIIQGSISKAAVATTYTYTIYVKDGGFQSFTLYINDNAATANRVQASFNISTVTTSSVSAAGTFTAASASLAAVGNGWYRCVLTGTSSTETSIQVRLLHGTGTGDGTSGLFIWGAQLEAGSFATSYIPTVASQVTRSADVASVNTLSPWFNASSGSFYAEADITGAPASNRLFEVHDGTDNNRLFTYTVNSSNSTRFHGVAAGASTEAIAASSSPTSGVPFKTAGAFTAGEYAVCYNGGTVATAAPAALPTGLSAMVLGARRSGAQVLNGHLRRLTFYPRRLSDAELQAITA